MLHKISYETLTRTAIYGAALSVSGCFLLYYRIQSNLASGPYFTEAVAAMRADKQACTLLGEPVRFLALRLGDKENKVTTEHAQVLIPVRGSKSRGQVRSVATVRNGKWELDRVVLELKERPESLVILSSHQTDSLSTRAHVNQGRADY